VASRFRLPSRVSCFETLPPGGGPEFHPPHLPARSRGRASSSFDSGTRRSEVSSRTWNLPVAVNRPRLATGNPDRRTRAASGGNLSRDVEFLVHPPGVGKKLRAPRGRASREFRARGLTKVPISSGGSGRLHTWVWAAMPPPRPCRSLVFHAAVRRRPPSRTRCKSWGPGPRSRLIRGRCARVRAG